MNSIDRSGIGAELGNAVNALHEMGLHYRRGFVVRMPSGPASGYT
jgi:hypothetical protein